MGELTSMHLFYLSRHKCQGVHAMGRPPQATQYPQPTAREKEAHQQRHHPHVTAHRGGRGEGELQDKPHTHTRKHRHTHVNKLDLSDMDMPHLKQRSACRVNSLSSIAH